MYKKNIKDVLKELDSSLDGITESEFIKRKKLFGDNKIEDTRKKTKLSLFLSQFDNLMIKLLLVVAAISLVYSFMTHTSYSDTILVIIIVLLNSIMGYIQESKAAAEIESLKKTEKTKCKVKRNGSFKIINSNNLVPGDIISLEAGDKIACDARIIECSNLFVDEAILTGESVPVEKNSEIIKSDVLINDRYNMLYSGCDVTKGRCIAVVCDIGKNTELGKISQSLIEEKDVPTPLQKRIEEISNTLTKIILVVITFVFAYNIFIMHNDILNVVMLSISLLVSAVPEGLPAVITITLSIGSKAMAKKRTIVRTISSVETIGDVEVICSDKTGTITQNKMTVVSIFNNKDIVDVGNYKCDSNNYLEKCMILCNDSSHIKNKFVGDPTETCLIDCLINNGISYDKVIKSNKRIDDLPFDSERKMMSTLCKNKDKVTLYSKGSLSSIIKCCSNILIDGKTKKITKKIANELFEKEKEMSSKALRVIAFAYKEENELSEDKLTFIGMVGMIDPPRSTVKDSIVTCKTAGITPIMITGDNLITAMEIAKSIGIGDKIKGIEGKDIDKLSDIELTDVVLDYSVYARVSPENKVRIVEALQKNNKVVAMTGDGVNDAPAIKLADIGIGMGKTGTEVTKSAADILLLDDCFSTIVDANYEGRRIYENIRNVIVYSLSSNFAEIFIVIAGMFMMVNALLPVHILYIDLVTDAGLAILLAFEKASSNIMNRPPRKSTGKFFTPFITVSLVISSLLEGIVVLICFLIGLRFNIEVAQTMALLCLIVQETLYALNCRNLKETVYRQGFFSNKIFNIGFIIIVVIQILTFMPPLKNWLHLASLSIHQVLFVFIVNILIFLILELSKVIIRNFCKDE